MADIEKSVIEDTVTVGTSDEPPLSTSSSIVKPNTWKYRRPRVGRHKLIWYASPLAQLLIVSFVCFLYVVCLLLPPSQSRHSFGHLASPWP